MLYNTHLLPEPAIEQISKYEMKIVQITMNHLSHHTDRPYKVPISLLIQVQNWVQQSDLLNSYMGKFFVFPTSAFTFNFKPTEDLLHRYPGCVLYFLETLCKHRHNFREGLI